MNGVTPVSNRVLQDSISGLVLLNTFVNNLGAGLEGIRSKFASGTKLGGAVDSLEGREILTEG